MAISIVLAEERHIPMIAEITNLEAERSAATVASAEEPTNRWHKQYVMCKDTYPWLVALSGTGETNQVVGYAKTAPYNVRDGFRWSVTLSVYIIESFKRKGVGDALYEVLFDLLRRQGYLNTYARIALPNPGSQRLHERYGLSQTGVLPQFAWKFGQWHDMAIFTGKLNDPPLGVEPPSLLDVESAWRQRMADREMV